MSQQNIKLIRNGYAAFARGAIPVILEQLDPEIEWTIPSVLPFGGTYRGPAGVRAFFESLAPWFDELRVRPERLVAEGERVVAFGHYRGRTAGGSSYEIPFAHYWTLRDGKPVRFYEYAATALAARSLGLRVAA